jgi:hypothetical protein
MGPIRGISNLQREMTLETGLAGWGVRIRTSEFGDARGANKL